MISFSPRTTRPNYGDSDFWTGSSWTDSYKTCMPNCTVYVAGRCSEAGIPHPTGFGAYHDFTSDGWTRISSINDVEPGDVIEFDDYSICFVESGRGSSAICSHSWYTTVSGRAHNYDGSLDRYSTDATGTSSSSVWNYCVSKWPDRCWFTHTAGGYTSGSFYAAYRPPGGGGGGNPDEPPVDPPSPGQQGHWEWVEETITSIIPHVYTYTDIYECGVGIFSDQSGTQDSPQAPILIHPGGGRLNERWDPFNMYTDERTLTYTADGQPVWSNWETKYNGMDSFPLGSQPTYGNGWEMEWQGDDD